MVILDTLCQIKRYKHCNSLIVRPKLNSYIEKLESKGRIEGHINLTLYFFKNAQTNTLLTKISAEESGDESWGRDEPFLDAFEEACNVIEDRVCDSNILRAVKF